MSKKNMDIYPEFYYFLFFKKFIIYLFLAVLGLCCCTWAFSSCSDWGLLTVVVSLVVEHGL